MTENNKIHQLIKELAEEKEISEERIKEIIIQSINKSYCSGENTGVSLHFEFDSGLSVYHTYQIVEKVNNPKREIQKNSELLKEGKIMGETFLLPLDIKNLPLLLSNEIRKQLQKDLEEANWEKQYRLFESLQGQLVWGVIQNFKENCCIIDIESKKGIGCWDKKELIFYPRRLLSSKEKLWFLVKEVQKKDNLPQVVLTRSDDLFLHRILENEIPEIKKKVIIVHHIIRLPGILSKVIVKSENLDANPLGACIGKDALRIKTISKLAFPEKVDIVLWSRDKKTLLFNLLLSNEPTELIIKQEKEWEVIISRWKGSLINDECRSKVLKKISDYLEINIHIRSLEESAVKKKENRRRVVREISIYKNVHIRSLEETDYKRGEKKYEKKY
ncbi:NusA N-terminal domain-containing protein [endosymbiont GvMRE of Glomus versiforme]|uniref:NusA N-terminal domain-containing protein n=1 Tax=endosymbiont GvMRE of Glomus versiforme TaxID=2039283 RepID=UPI0015596E19|nr:NusA N-terminal domain-containing protein [endosymbiont GvMRE of Glomus versiforme]